MFLRISPSLKTKRTTSDENIQRCLSRSRSREKSQTSRTDSFCSVCTYTFIGKIDVNLTLFFLFFLQANVPFSRRSRDAAFHQTFISCWTILRTSTQSYPKTSLSTSIGFFNDQSPSACVRQSVELKSRVSLILDIGNSGLHWILALGSNTLIHYRFIKLPHPRFARGLLKPPISRHRESLLSKLNSHSFLYPQCLFGGILGRAPQVLSLAPSSFLAAFSCVWLGKAILLSFRI